MLQSYKCKHLLSIRADWVGLEKGSKGHMSMSVQGKKGGGEVGEGVGWS